jgi:hypothetical protein
MALRSYLPSTQFVVIVGSIVVSGGLVVAAQKITSPAEVTNTLTASSQTVPTGDWLAALREIEGQDVGAPPATTTAATFNALLTAAASSNITDTVARSLLINLTEAKSQGLGSDIPTQDKLIAQALDQAQKTRSAPTYSATDLTLSSNSAAAQKEYGNAVIRLISKYPTTNFNNVVYVIGQAGSKEDPKELEPLNEIQQGYQSLARDLLKTPVPPTLAPLHLQTINDLVDMAGTMDDIDTLFTDSVRSLGGLELYQALNNETIRVFISIAQSFKQNGILFNADEPGSAWSAFLSAQ